MEFCKAFNAATQNMEQGTPTPVVVTAYSDRSFSFETKTPPASWYLRKAANVAKGSKVPNRDKVGKVTMAQRSEEHTSELQSLMRNSYADFCLKKKITIYLFCVNYYNITHQQSILLVLYYSYTVDLSTNYAFR